ncbi:MAG: hypothetical protein CAPSK01_001666 [Candidatus Accumulibacter vicinus]|uniref:Uncharacterized protein n=1 Tax=Candidatus Accumulibacter vicinus TaxID=2954382 RepID=A0A084Y267_9PROT|nr:MAG: hypothetical protein CAPSK01_001666 [Candidatus Accumulibacter vicinus]
MGLPVLRLPSSSTHAVTNTPAEPQTAFRSHSPVTSAFPVFTPGRLPHHTFSRPAQCSIKLRPACSPSSLQNPLHQRLQPLRYLHDCSSCYRPERKLPDGFRTRWKTAPLHGARERKCWTPRLVVILRSPERPYLRPFGQLKTAILLLRPTLSIAPQRRETFANSR